MKRDWLKKKQQYQKFPKILSNDKEWMISVMIRNIWANLIMASNGPKKKNNKNIINENLYISYSSTFNKAAPMVKVRPFAFFFAENKLSQIP